MYNCHKVTHLFINIRSYTILVITLIAFVTLPQLFADDMTQGEMAGIIRSSDNPCAKVLKMQVIGENSWKVQCNSGEFHVTKNSEGQFSVDAVDNN